MKMLKKGGGVVEKRGEEETKSMPHAPVLFCTSSLILPSLNVCLKSLCVFGSFLYGLLIYELFIISVVY